MSNPVEKVFSQRQTVLETVRGARDVFGSTKTTRKQYKAMQDALGFALLYGPEDLRVTVEATLTEANRRELYFIPLWQRTDEETLAGKGA